jgi:hypothetical protein
MTVTSSSRSAPPEVQGLAAWGHRIFKGENADVLRGELESRVALEPSDAGAWYDLGILHELNFNQEMGLACQARALGLTRVFRLPARRASPGFRLLMFAAPGDIKTNVPVSFLLTDSDVTVDMVYLLPGEPLPDHLPDHDLAMVGVCESDANKPLLAQLETLLPTWPRPYILEPAGIQSMERNNLWRLLESAPGISMPPTIQLDRTQVAALAQGGAQLSELSQPVEFPFLLRPLDSHGGHGLERIEGAAGVSAYLDRNPEEQFFFAPFVDYRGQDGLYHKYRVALLDGTPYLGHMAVADLWMLHYLNAGMELNAGKRAEEAQVFASFDRTFAVRHASAFKALYERTGLEYITIDCSETSEGELLIFEAGTAMVIHDMDSPELFPYKAPNMQRIFRAFRALLEQHARSEGVSV